MKPEDVPSSGGREPGTPPRLQEAAQRLLDAMDEQRPRPDASMAVRAAKATLRSVLGTPTREPSGDPGRGHFEHGVTCWVCPDCAFTFDASHTDAPDGNTYSCPACFQDARLRGAPAGAAGADTGGATEPATPCPHLITTADRVPGWSVCQQCGYTIKGPSTEDTP